MRSGEVSIRPNGHYPELVDSWMATIVMLLDVVHVDCIPNRLDLKQLFGVVEQVGVLANQLLVTLEVYNINLPTKARHRYKADTLIANTF
jgi:hypothetical protein